MKKRIISLILVVALSILTLTGCAFNYTKGVEYAEFDTSIFKTALQNLVITDGDFGTDETKRNEKVLDAIAVALLGKTTANDKKFEGTIGKYDSVYYAYMAKDADGNIFYADKMLEQSDATKMSNVQLGLSTNNELNKAIAAVLEGKNIQDYIYSTSSAKAVGEGDAISISYFVEWNENGTGERKTDTVWNEYHVVGGNDALAFALIGTKVGETKGSVTVEANPSVQDSVEKRYSNIKVESIVKDNSVQTVEDQDNVFVSYTISLNVSQWKNDDNTYTLPAELEKMEHDIANDVFTATVKYETVVAQKYTDDDYKVEGEGDTATKTLKEESKRFTGEIVGKEAGSTTTSLVIKNGVIDGKTVEITYKNVKIDWIVNDVNQPLEVKYTPYTEELNGTESEATNKKQLTNIYGKKITLNQVELTYYIFPIYYVDVADVTSEDATAIANAATVLLNKFYSAINSTETAEHDHTEEPHEHTTEYVFESLNKDKDGNEYKYTYVKPEGAEEDADAKADDGKTLATLVGELVTLYTAHTEKDKALTTALSNLTTAQSNYAKEATKDSTEQNEATLAELLTKRQNAETAYNTAKYAEQEAIGKVNVKVARILECKKGEATPASALIEDYKTYQYDTLEATYEEAIKTNLATAILKYLQTNVKFDDNNLPKKAVKQAYKAIMNTYKYNFYEGKTDSTSNYTLYNGDFNAYLIKTLGVDSVEAAKEVVMKEARQTVKDIIIIYVFTEAVEEIYADADVTLTKAEKKEIKKNIEYTANLYEQYYGISYEYNLDDSYHAAQFDKVMNFLLETKDATDENDNKVYYKNILYTTSTANA